MAICFTFVLYICIYVVSSLSLVSFVIFLILLMGSIITTLLTIGLQTVLSNLFNFICKIFYIVYFVCCFSAVITGSIANLGHFLICRLYASYIAHIFIDGDDNVSTTTFQFKKRISFFVKYTNKTPSVLSKLKLLWIFVFWFILIGISQRIISMCMNILFRR
jgi:hypothetical protein